jgi:Mg/Co/Ni transporter MgtE
MDKNIPKEILDKFHPATPAERLRAKIQAKYDEAQVARAVTNKVVTIQQILQRNKEVLERIKHKPIYSFLGDRTVYFKREVDDDFLFRKTKSISLNSAALEKCDVVVINIVYRDVKVMATKDDIKAHKDVKTFHGECKYYYPIEKWEVIQGDVNWVEKVIADFKKRDEEMLK